MFHTYHSRIHRIAFLLVAVAGASTAGAQWVQFDRQTLTRLNVADPSLVIADQHEKAYAWDDFDKDGDIDLIIVRKLPYIITAGPLRNVLLINENGVLTDRTSDFASASDVEGDQGFLTPTTDRDVVLVDVDLDGWIDIVTAPTLSHGEPKHIGHPRVYRNLGCTGACNGTEDWSGFRYEDNRIPAMLSYSGQSGFNPCMCSVSAGDVNGDSYPDLWFADYDDGCKQAGADFNSRLLINLGDENPGHFVDQTDPRFNGLVDGLPFPVNVDSLSGAIVDLNGDGRNEIILESEGIIDIAYNDPDNEGNFEIYSQIDAFSTYFLNVADLNNDGLMDIITTDDAQDRYYLHQGLNEGAASTANFLSFQYTYNHTGDGNASSDDGFGDDTRAADLDKDGWLDVLTADRDFTQAGCVRRAHIYHNKGGQPGDNVVLTEETTGSKCENFFGNPGDCLVASLPADRLIGTDDFGIFDIDGDSWLDLVIGTCNGTEVYINVPPVGPAGNVPDGGDVPGSMLVLYRAPGSAEISLAWGASCTLEDTDYAVYQGALGGDFTSHSEVSCTTNGATTVAFEPAAEGTYYLVVPHNGTFEGGYGVDSQGSPRQQGSTACRAMNAQACE